MAIIICPECGKERTDQIKACPHCGYKIKKTKGIKQEQDDGYVVVDKGRRKKILLILIPVALGILFCVYFFFSPKTFDWCCFHKTSAATCTSPEKCERCGKEWGDPLGHSWAEATCTEASKCTVCGITEGEPLGHNWKAATCTIPKTCSVCGLSNGEL